MPENFIYRFKENMSFHGLNFSTFPKKGTSSTGAFEIADGQDGQSLIWTWTQVTWNSPLLIL